MKLLSIGLVSLCISIVGVLASAIPVTENPKLEAPHVQVRDEAFLVQLHRDLVQIESTSGKEAAIIDWLSTFFKTRGWTVKLQEVAPNRSNLFASPPGVLDGKSRVLLTSHVDTVPPFIPYSVTTSNGTTTFRGRGVNDAKGSVATQIVAVLNILARKDLTPTLPTDALSMLFVVGEETGGEGMSVVSKTKQHNYSHVIFGEPTEGTLVCGHKGAFTIALNATGRAAHSGYPQAGVNANNILIEALGALHLFEGLLPSSQKFGPTTLNMGLISGGVAMNVISPQAQASGLIRLATGTPADLQKLIRQVLSPVIKRAQQLGGKLELTFPISGFGPVDIDCDINIAGLTTSIVSYGTDVPLLIGSHKRYLYGPGSILTAHTPNESVTLAELNTAVTVYEKMILNVLGIASPN